MIISTVKLSRGLKETQHKKASNHIALYRHCKIPQHKKASNHHANLPLEMYTFTL